MADRFYIRQKKTDNHGLWSARNFDKTHPHLYLVTNQQGHDVLLLSKVGTYKPGTQITISGYTLSGSVANTYFVDLSDPGPQMGPAAFPMQAPLPVGDTIKPEIMVSLSNLVSRGQTLTMVAGEVFYLPPGATKGVSEALRQVMQEGAEITILTNVPFETLNNYKTHFQRAFGFAGMMHVREPGVVPGSKTITAMHLISGTSQESQRQILDAINQQP